MSRIVILDNGAHRIKAGYSGESNPNLYYNCLTKSKTDRKKIYVANELEECVDKSALFYVLPFERGYLVNWDVEFQIWDRIFGKDFLNVDFQNSKLVLTDPGHIAKAVRDVSSEIAFETYQFDSFLRTSSSSCVAGAHYAFNSDESEGCCIVVDSGYSFTHIVPFIQGKIIRNGIVRIDIGGKALTNQLKEWVSYRYLNVLEETFVINQCKEDICYVANNFEKEMKKCLEKSLCDSIRKDYFLPDFISLHRGIVKSPTKQLSDQEHAKISLAVERFAIPEILFHPSNIEKNQMGIVEAINFSLREIPEGRKDLRRLHLEIRHLALKNIFLVGGNTLFDGYQQRIETDLRPYVDSYLDFKIKKPEDPIIYPWQCASKLTDEFSNENQFKSKFVSKAEYAEFGLNFCQSKFQNYFDIF